MAGPRLARLWIASSGPFAGFARYGATPRNDEIYDWAKEVSVTAWHAGYSDVALWAAFSLIE